MAILATEEDLRDEMIMSADPKRDFFGGTDRFKCSCGKRHRNLDVGERETTVLIVTTLAIALNAAAVIVSVAAYSILSLVY